jgi:hypothetical protein
VRAIRCVFETGREYFGDSGLIEPCHLIPDSRERAEAEVVFVETLFAAWQRLGPTFMQDWQPSFNVTVPFALIAFGDPTKPRKPTEPLEVLRERVRASVA